METVLLKFDSGKEMDILLKNLESCLKDGTPIIDVQSRHNIEYSTIRANQILVEELDFVIDMGGKKHSLYIRRSYDNPNQIFFDLRANPEMQYRITLPEGTAHFQTFGEQDYEDTYNFMENIIILRDKFERIDRIINRFMEDKVITR